MCYKYARIVNEELSLPPRSEYFRPPPFAGLPFVLEPLRQVEGPVIVLAPRALHDELAEGIDFSQPLEDQLPPEHPEPLSVQNGVATYVSRGRAYRGPVPIPPLRPLGHGAGGSSPAPGPAPRVGRGSAILAMMRARQNPGRSRD